jgi:hypothetical protein
LNIGSPTFVCELRSKIDFTVANEVFFLEGP